MTNDIDAERSVARLKRWVVDQALAAMGRDGIRFGARKLRRAADLRGSAAPRRRRGAPWCRRARSMSFRMRRCSAGGPKARLRRFEAAHRLIDRYHGVDGDHGWIFSIHPDGAVHDAKRDFYAHSFALFGLAWAYKLAPEPRFLSAALNTLSVLDQHFESPTGGYHSVLPADAGKREQNPHMHLFEAMLAWFEATGREMFLARAAELYGMMAARFFQHRTGILAEYFDGSWNPREGIDGRICEPGHHFEWSWLLRRYAALSGRGDSPIAKALKAVRRPARVRLRRIYRRPIARRRARAQDFPPLLASHRSDQGRGRRGRNWRREAAARGGADDRSAACGFPWPPRRGRLDRPCRCDRRSDRRHHAGQHALSRLSRGGGSGPRLGKARGARRSERPTSNERRSDPAGRDPGGRQGHASWRDHASRSEADAADRGRPAVPRLPSRDDRTPRLSGHPPARGLSRRGSGGGLRRAPDRRRHDPGVAGAGPARHRRRIDGRARSARSPVSS